MKNIQGLVLLIFLIFGCKSSQDTMEENRIPENISAIQIEAITRGYKEEVSASPEEIRISATNGKRSKKLSNEEWNTILKSINNIDLEKISTFEAPTNDRMFDGDLATTITIKTETDIYSSQTFDKKNPPKELANLVKIIYSLSGEQ